MSASLLDACARIIRQSQRFPFPRAEEIAERIVATLRPAVLEEAAGVADAAEAAVFDPLTNAWVDRAAITIAIRIRALATPTDTEKDT